MSEVLVPEMEVIKIGDRSYSIGKLSLKQGIMFTKFVAQKVIAKQEKFQKFMDDVGKDSSNMDDLMTMLDLLDENEVFEFIGLLIKEDDHDFLAENLDLDGAMDVVLAICRQNDFAKVKKKIQQVKDLLQIKKES